MLNLPSSSTTIKLVNFK